APELALDGHDRSPSAAAEKRLLEERADRQLAQWAAPGTIVLPVIFLLVGLASGLAFDRTVFFLATLLATCVVLTIRLWWVTRFDSLYERDPARWRFVFSAATLGAVVIWESQIMFTIWLYGMGSATLFALVSNTALASFAPMNYADRRHLMLGYCSLAAIPPVIVLISLGTDDAYAWAIGGAVFGAYLLLQGMRLHRQRWHALTASRREELHAEQLRTARDAARDADHAKVRFLAHMNHELRTPLTSIIGLAEQLEHTSATAEQRRVIRPMLGAADNLLRLVDEVLDFTRVEAGTIRLRPVPFSPADLLADLETTLRPATENKGLRFVVEVGKTVPRSMLGDIDRLRQVLVSLIDNAIKFTPEGAVRVAVAAAPKRGDRVTLAFTVSDSGPGIPEALRKKIFEPFEQGLEDPVDASGAGLGLAISRRLVDQMDGSLQVESRPGHGTTVVFEVALPVVDVPDMAVDTRPSEQARSDRAAGAPSRSLDPSAASPVDGPILVVDDNTLNLELVARQLEILGHHPDTAPSGEQALEMFDRQRYGLILLDCMMPGVDGYQTARLIRERETERNLARTPIVAVTANALPADLDACFDAGMDDWLTKPFRIRDLREHIDRWYVSPEKP
ncbi:MAG: ATP-binding protein, partial [Acidobacteriota bacterium]